MNVFKTCRGFLSLLLVFIVSLGMFPFSQAAAPLGSVDLLDGTKLFGYAYDPDMGALPSEVRVYVDGVLFRSTIADLGMPQLVSQGITPNPEHGFAVKLPEDLSIGDHTIKVVTLDEPARTEVELLNSPKIVNVPDPNQNPNPPPQNPPQGGGGADFMPDPFVISPITDARVSTRYTSTSTVLSGFIDSLQLIVKGGNSPSIIKNGIDTQSTVATVSPGDAISIASNSSSQLNTPVVMDVTLGVYTTQWIITTSVQAPPALPQCIESSQVFNVPGETQYAIPEGCTGITIEAYGSGKNAPRAFFQGAPPQNRTYAVIVGSANVPISTVKTGGTTLLTTSPGTPDPLFPNGKVIISWKSLPQFLPSPQNPQELQDRINNQPGGNNPPDPIPQNLRIPTIIYHHPDHLTSTSIDTDDQGSIIQTTDYYPYGSTRIHTTDPATDFHNDYLYTGKEQDEQTSLMYYGARYYDPSISRFLSLDPASLQNPEQFLSDPQQLNTYSYARNNPLIYNDPSGEKVEVFFSPAGPWHAGRHAALFIQPDHPEDFAGVSKIRMEAAPDKSWNLAKLILFDQDADIATGVGFSTVPSPLKEYSSDFIGPREQISDTEHIQRLFDAFEKYNDDRFYWIQGNSNNFATSLLNASGTDEKAIQKIDTHGFAPGFSGSTFSEMYGRQTILNAPRIESATIGTNSDKNANSQQQNNKDQIVNSKQQHNANSQ